MGRGINYREETGGGGKFYTYQKGAGAGKGFSHAEGAGWMGVGCVQQVLG